MPDALCFRAIIRGNRVCPDLDLYVSRTLFSDRPIGQRPNSFYATIRLEEGQVIATVDVARRELLFVEMQISAPVGVQLAIVEADLGELRRELERAIPCVFLSKTGEEQLTELVQQLPAHYVFCAGLQPDGRPVHYGPVLV